MRQLSFVNCTPQIDKAAATDVTYERAPVPTLQLGRAWPAGTGIEEVLVVKGGGSVVIAGAHGYARTTIVASVHTLTGQGHVGARNRQ